MEVAAAGREAEGVSGQGQEVVAGLEVAEPGEVSAQEPEVVAGRDDATDPRRHRG